MAERVCSGVDGVPVVREETTEPLQREDLLASPMDLFAVWFSDAADVPLANAVVLSTATLSGVPSSRVVLLKDHSPAGFTIFTNYESRKGRELDANPACALSFWWKPFVRQVRVEGKAVRLDATASDRYFALRPRGSQIGAWASPQSRVIADREALLQRVIACEEQFGDGPIPRPSHWGGYQIVPSYMEFWQGGGDRLHDRYAYTKQQDNGWHLERLAP